MFSERVIDGEDDIYIGFALQCITMVLEFQTMVRVRSAWSGTLSGAIVSGTRQRVGSLETDECL